MDERNEIIIVAIVLTNGGRNVYKILIVEDDINISEMVTDYLSGEGYEVLPVYTGESAISALEQESYDLALIDFMLPGFFFFVLF